MLHFGNTPSQLQVIEYYRYFVYHTDWPIESYYSLRKESFY